jgi:hypothetical protein
MASLKILAALTASWAALALAANCNALTLMTAADAYVGAQTSGHIDLLHSVLGVNWTYQENNKQMNIEKGVLTKALSFDNRRTNVDLTQCATYTELIAADPRAPYVIGTQIRHDADGNITMIDSIVTTTGAWLFDAAKTLQHIDKETWDPIPPEKQDSREAIKAAGDAYLDLWSSATAEARVPWGTPCARLEGSAYTGKGRPDDSCKTGIPTNHTQAPNSHRRYVIDEEMGSVSIFCVWEHMMNAADSHEFRLEGGKLRYVHTMTSCGDQVCKL